MRLDQEFLCSPETRILRWYGYKRGYSQLDIYRSSLNHVHLLVDMSAQSNTGIVIE